LESPAQYTRCFAIAQHDKAQNDNVNLKTFELSALALGFKLYVLRFLAIVAPMPRSKSVHGSGTGSTAMNAEGYPLADTVRFPAESNLVTVPI
jgi:hypothetical protein